VRPQGRPAAAAAVGDGQLCSAAAAVGAVVCGSFSFWRVGDGDVRASRDSFD
jgi:hypothetical protein